MADVTPTPGERAYTDYFRSQVFSDFIRMNLKGGEVPAWADLPPELKTWWESAAIHPPGSLPWWQNAVFWFNATVLVLALVESQLGALQQLLPGSIFAWVAFALPLANAGIKALRLLAAQKVTGTTGPR